MLFDLGSLTGIHTVISLLAIVFGLAVLAEMLGARLPSFVGLVFVLLAALTSATGFLFTFNGVLPSHIVGAIALVVLAGAVFARYVGQLRRSWRWFYAAAMVASVYFLAFVGVAQLFAKVPAIHALAPTQAEPPFAIAQAVLLGIFVIIGIAAARRYRPVGTA
jgi:uncharacterized membrane protein